MLKFMYVGNCINVHKVFRETCMHTWSSFHMIGNLGWRISKVQKFVFHFFHGLLVTCFLMQLLIMTFNSLPYLIIYTWSTINLIHPTCFSSQVNYVMNTLLSFNMVIAFLVAVILDNTVPGSRQERGVYVWSEAETARREPAVSRDYELPFKVGKVFRWVKWVGLWCKCHRVLWSPLMASSSLIPFHDIINTLCSWKPNETKWSIEVLFCITIYVSWWVGCFLEIGNVHQMTSMCTGGQFFTP